VTAGNTWFNLLTSHTIRQPITKSVGDVGNCEWLSLQFCKFLELSKENPVNYKLCIICLINMISVSRFY
jgi:hypothetical protein